jgi:uncharacterized protein
MLQSSRRSLLAKLFRLRAGGALSEKADEGAAQKEHTTGALEAWVGKERQAIQELNPVQKLKDLAKSVVAMTSRYRDSLRSSEGGAPVVRWIKPSETTPRGKAPGARVRLLTTRPDGTRTHVIVLSPGDELWTALAIFAKTHKVVSAQFSAIGAVRDPEVAWFDPDRKEYKGMTLREQMEVLMFSGDIAVGANGQPVVHAHIVLGRSDGSTWGGHLLHATASPTLELYITTYPGAVHKRLDPATGLQLIDLSLGR